MASEIGSCFFFKIARKCILCEWIEIADSVCHTLHYAKYIIALQNSNLQIHKIRGIENSILIQNPGFSDGLEIKVDINFDRMFHFNQEVFFVQLHHVRLKGTDT